MQPDVECCVLSLYAVCASHEVQPHGWSCVCTARRGFKPLKPPVHVAVVQLWKASGVPTHCLQRYLSYSTRVYTFAGTMKCGVHPNTHLCIVCMFIACVSVYTVRICAIVDVLCVPLWMYCVCHCGCTMCANTDLSLPVYAVSMC